MFLYLQTSVSLQHRVTVIGAIGPSLKHNKYCAIYDGPNNYNFRKFLLKLKKQLRNPTAARRHTCASITTGPTWHISARS